MAGFDNYATEKLYTKNPKQEEIRRWIESIMRYYSDLNAWEEEFMKSVDIQFRRGDVLSEKQLHRL